jgi:hypothetical protein
VQTKLNLVESYEISFINKHIVWQRNKI